MVEKMRGSKPRKMKNTESLNPASSSLFASSSFYIFIKIFCLWSKNSSKMGIVQRNRELWYLAEK